MLLRVSSLVLLFTALAAACGNDDHHGSTQTTTCPAGYQSDASGNCADVDECSVGHGGCSANLRCTNTVGSFTCDPCPLGTYANGTICQADATAQAATIGSNGGQIAAANGSWTLVVPANAVSSLTTIAVYRPLTAPVVATPDVELLGETFLFDPIEQTFAGPLHLTVVYAQADMSEAGIEEQSIDLQFLDPTTGAVTAATKLSQDMTANTVTVDITHFGYVVLTRLGMRNAIAGYTSVDAIEAINATIDGILLAQTDDDAERALVAQDQVLFDAYIAVSEELTGTSPLDGLAAFAPQALSLDVVGLDGVATATWSASAPVDTFDLFWSTSATCDIANIGGCPNSGSAIDVTSPHTVSGLSNDLGYYVVLRANLSGGGTAIANAEARLEGLSIDGDIWGLQTNAGGTTYIAGQFDRIGGVPVANAAVVDQRLGRLRVRFPTVSGQVNAAVSDGAGGWYIGGLFSTVAAATRANIAHIAADGSVLPFSPALDGAVDALARADGVLYVGGTFTHVDATPRAHLVAFDSSDALTAWNPSADGDVNAIAVGGSTIYLGGQFATVATQARAHLAAVDTTGALTAFDPEPNDLVLAILPTASELFVGGAFSQIAGQARTRIASFDSSGTLTSYAPTVDDTVRALAADSDNFYVGGNFHGYDSNAVDAFVAVRSSDHALIWAPALDGNVRAVTIVGTSVYIGGEFVTANTQQRNFSAAFENNGTLLPWSANTSAFIDTLAADSTNILVGGSFPLIGGTLRNNLAAIDAAGTLTAWNPNADKIAQTMALGADGTVYVGGAFTQIGGQARNAVGAIDASGNVTSWAPTISGTGAFVATLATDTDNVYIGGLFSQVDGSARSNIASVSISGGSLTTWDPGLDHVVLSLFVDSGLVYAGGLFHTVGGSTTRNFVAAIDSTGAATAWNPDPDDEVIAIAVNGSTVYLGGNFLNIGSTARSYLAAVDTSGTLLACDPEPNAVVEAAVVSGSSLYIGGTFTSLGSGAVTRSGIATLALDCSVSGTDASIDGAIQTITVSGVELRVGGIFDQVNGQNAANFARINASGNLLP